MRQKILVLLILLSFLFSGDIVAGVLRLDFSAHSTEGNENSMSTYSYVKEPRIEETGHTRGLKSGSFNYLEDGTKIEFNETIGLGYGNATEISNSSLSHTLNLTFKGNLGISEMYGSGLYPNNRGLAAWKKIRYETSEYLKTKEGKKIRDFKANEMWVDSAANMYTRDDESVYSFEYNANAKDAVVETRDYAGWSNRTGSRRIDVEHSTMMTGNFELSNIFQETMFPGPDVAGDWLPCCFNSTIPSLRQPTNPWPSQVVINTLREYPFQPKIACKDGKEECGEWQQNKTNSSATEGQVCKDGFKECPESGCPGFECIKTFNEDQYDYAPEVEIFGKKINAIQAIYSYGKLPENESYVLYPVSVRNIGINTLNDVKLKGSLPNEFDPISIYVMSTSGSHTNLTQEIEWDSTRKSFTYVIDDLTRGAGRNIYLLAKATGNADPDEAKFSVTGNTTEDLIVKDDASWLPIDPMDLDYAHNVIKLQGSEEPVNPIELEKGQVQVNNTTWILGLNVTNGGTVLLKDVNLKVDLAGLRTPTLIYEVIDQEVSRVFSEPYKSIPELKLNEIDPGKTICIYIVIPEEITTDKLSEIEPAVSGSLNGNQFSKEGGGESPLAKEEILKLLSKAIAKMK